MTSAATEALLGVLKYVLLALLYLFFARVLWAVWSEVRGPRQGALVAQQRTGPADPTMPAPAPTAADVHRAKRDIKPQRGRRGTVGRFVILEPKATRGASFAIGDELTVGRAGTCTIGMPDDTFVSQLHARVYRDAGAAMIEDLGSTNGTYVNGKRVDKAEVLTKGDRVQIGSTVFEVE